MPLPSLLAGRLRCPAIAAPMFLVSGPDLVVETCRGGILGTFPALNGRTSAVYAEWLDEIAGRLVDEPDAAPFGVNLIVHRSNPRLERDLTVTVEGRVPLVITSLGAVAEVVAAVHGYGGLVFHDVTGRRHAEKALAAGVDGLIAVAAGAGGHAGTLNPFALLDELRTIFTGPIALAGSIGRGRQIAAAQLMGADLAYLGTRFVATQESLAPPAYKAMVAAAEAGDIVYTPAVSGVPANFLRPSLMAAGYDPAGGAPARALDLDGEAKAWRDVWSAGHGVAGITDVPPVADLCRRLCAEYEAAMSRRP